VLSVYGNLAAARAVRLRTLAGSAAH
jgi:hypothetical protein